ncbi:GDYXXLXY domain-containing protein [Erwinia sp. V71]|uniref:GDYXXLXY domain-containing protein n=1 Tax=Erwinia sp. V71 TaxID=3369424 RepID=UPI003F61A2AE
MRKGLLLGALLLILLATNLAIYQKEQLLAHGGVVRLALAPVDPRALLQGDYMALNYALNNHLSVDEQPENRRLIVTVNAQHVAVDAVWDRGQPLADNQRYLQTHQGNRQLGVASDAWFFEEGHADDFAMARYGELRVDEEGTALLVALLDEQLKPLTAAPK